MERVNVTIGPLHFDRADYDADADVLYLHAGDPQPAEHVRYAGHKGRIAIRTGEPLDGDRPPRALRLVREWCELPRDDLEANWVRVEAESPLVPVEPLP